jgi:hypothetical protein
VTDPATTSPRSGQPVDISVVLPGDWWMIPLHDEDRRSGAIRNLVARQFRGIDNQPVVKAEACRKLALSAQDAAGAGGRLMAISLMEAAGLPVSATLTAYWIDLGLPTGASHVLDLSANFVAADGDRADAGGDKPRYDRARFDAGAALRRIRTVRTDGRDADRLGDLEVLQVDYWIEMPGHLGLVQLAFSTAMVVWKEPMLGMFDAIAGSTAWRYSGPEGVSSSPSKPTLDTAGTRAVTIPAAPRSRP